jgi:hypothetical protein
MNPSNYRCYGQTYAATLAGRKQRADLTGATNIYIHSITRERHLSSAFGNSQTLISFNIIHE